jgi:uncharacterized membrane protein YkoI
MRPFSAPLSPRIHQGPIASGEVNDKVEVGMNRKLAVSGALALALATVGGGIAVAASGRGDDDALTGEARDKAIAAALAHTGGGAVVETEIGDDGAAYGVEIRLADGRTVEVGLDERFHVVTREDDEDGAGEHDDER